MESKKKKQIISMIALAVALVWLYPFYLMIVNALKSRAEIFTNTLGLPQDIQWGNFSEAMERMNFWGSFSNSLIITVVSVIVLVVCSSMAAYALSRNPGKVSNWVYGIFAVAVLIPFQSIMIPLIGMFGQANMLNRPGLVFMYLGIGSSMAIFLYFGALRSVPKDLDEAACIDGCSKFQTFWHIIFPILKPTTVTVIVLNSIWFWNDYLLPSLVINRPEWRTIPLMTFFFFGEFSRQWNLALAALIIAIVPVIIMYMFLQKYIIKGVSDGAVK
ncbi:MAG: carbohydrate ABC transporter permease [Turicibacter sp.]|nr:carbohydrate ABC transporter permease [Turicibacter sp.]